MENLNSSSKRRGKEDEEHINEDGKNINVETVQAKEKLQKVGNEAAVIRKQENRNYLLAPKAVKSIRIGTDYQAVLPSPECTNPNPSTAESSVAV